MLRYAEGGSGRRQEGGGTVTVSNSDHDMPRFLIATSVSELNMVVPHSLALERRGHAFGSYLTSSMRVDLKFSFLRKLSFTLKSKPHPFCYSRKSFALGPRKIWEDMGQFL